MKPRVLAAATLFLAAPAYAVTGVELREMCHQAMKYINDSSAQFDAGKAMFCMGAVESVYDILRAQPNEPRNGKKLCIPDQTTTAQLIVHVTDVMDKYPKVLDLPTGNIIQFALIQEYICDAPRR